MKLPKPLQLFPMLGALMLYHLPPIPNLHNVGGEAIGVVVGYAPTLRTEATAKDGDIQDAHSAASFFIFLWILLMVSILIVEAIANLLS